VRLYKRVLKDEEVASLFVGGWWRAGVRPANALPRQSARVNRLEKRMDGSVVNDTKNRPLRARVALDGELFS